MMVLFGNMKDKCRKMIRVNNKGTSMVTVVISFALLLIFVTGFYQVQKVSENIMSDSRDLRVNNRELLKSFYLDQTENEKALEDRLVFEGKDGSFWIEGTLYRARKEGLQGTIYYYDAKTTETTE